MSISFETVLQKLDSLHSAYAHLDNRYDDSGFYANQEELLTIARNQISSARNRELANLMGERLGELLIKTGSR